MRRLRRGAAIALLVLVAAGCSGRERPTFENLTGPKTVTVQDVQDAFAAKGVPFQREIDSIPGGPHLWPVHHDVDEHVLALLSAFGAPDTSGSASTLNVWVFDSAKSAKEALERTPQVARGPTLVLQQANIVLVADGRHEKRVQAALVALRKPGE
jgi:hypothetical protein